MPVTSNEFKKASLKKKYDWSGKSYRELMGKISKENYRNIAKTVLKYDKDKYSKIMPKTKRGKKIVLPDVNTIIDKSPTVLKAATEGELLTKSLRERLRKDIKNTLLENGITNKNGRINKRVLNQMKTTVTKTFGKYTKQPTNLKTIATTEAMTVINNVRYEYIKSVQREARQSGFEIVKKWIHNPNLSKEPRKEHIQLGKSKSIKLSESFIVGGIPINSPHDPKLPPEEKINCHCELEFKFEAL